jgi:hypothetical protein
MIQLATLSPSFLFVLFSQKIPLSMPARLIIHVLGAILS